MHFMVPIIKQKQSKSVLRTFLFFFFSFFDKVVLTKTMKNIIPIHYYDVTLTEIIHSKKFSQWFYPSEETHPQRALYLQLLF